MRILHLLPTFDTGGLGSLALELIRGWKPGDTHAALAGNVVGNGDRLMPEFMQVCTLGAKAVNRNVFRPQMFVEDVAAWARQAGPFDGAVIYNFLDHLWYARALARAGFAGRVVCHVGTVIPPNTNLPQVFGDRAAEHVQFLPSPDSTRRVLLAVGAPPERVLPYYWNGVNLARFPVKPPEPEPPPAVFPEVVFGFTGRMAPGAKDFDRLIRAYARISGVASTAARLVIAGEGPVRIEYQNLAQDLGLVVNPRLDSRGLGPPRSVRFVGNVPSDQIPAFLRGLSVFVMAALPIEGMSMALVEAIVTGLPIIGTDVPANREVLNTAGCGLLTADTEALVTSMEWLATDHGARVKLAKLSRQARPNFDISQAAARYRQALCPSPSGADETESTVIPLGPGA